MDRMFFEEKQKLAAVWSWVVVVVGLAMSFPLLRILYFQLLIQEEQQLSVKGAISLLGGLMLVVAVVVWLTATYSLEVKIGNSGIYYRSFPSHQDLTLIEKKAIVGYMIREITFNDYGKANAANVYSISGSTVLEVTLAGDQKIVLGTQNKESLDWAMKKLLDNPV